MDCNKDTVIKNITFDSNGITTDIWTSPPTEQQITRFRELQKKSIQFEDLTIDKIFYDYGRKFIITSKCLVGDYSCLYFDILKFNDDNSISTFKEKLFLNDKNIVGGGYNLQRCFDNLNDSMEYTQLLKLFRDDKGNFFIKPTKCLYFDGENIKNNDIIIYSICEKQNSEKNTIKKQWTPKTGEYCMFYNKNSKSFRVAQFKQIGNGKNMGGKFKDMGGNYFDFCLPYNHQLPDFLK